ncbi:MAG: YHS domain-containing protein [Cyclobacteriaceae bacterium]|nr:YHS domain-containing protein [Cyclobacteriaceae bacterium]
MKNKKNHIILSTLLFVSFLVCHNLSLHAQQPIIKKHKVAVFIYQGVELLDFAGPLEVFSNTESFDVFTVAPKIETIVAMNKNIQFIPNYSIATCPQPDIIVFPGANMEGLMPVYNDSTVIKWILEIHNGTSYTMSVCTGAAFLSKAGILDGHSVTTHWGATKNLQTITPKATVVEGKRFVEDGKVLTTAGVSAGLDGALHLISKMVGKDEALRVARNIEYDKWNPDAGLVIGSERIFQKAPAKKIVPVKKEMNKKEGGPNAGVLKEESIDPFCKMKVPKGTTITVMHKGKQYGFCSEGCKEYFLENPEKYLAGK